MDYKTPNIATPVVEIDTSAIEEAIAFNEKCEATKIVAAESQIEMNEEIKSLKKEITRNNKKSTIINWVIVIVSSLSLIASVIALIVTIVK